MSYECFDGCFVQIARKENDVRGHNLTILEMEISEKSSRKIRTAWCGIGLKRTWEVMGDDVACASRVRSGENQKRNFHIDKSNVFARFRVYSTRLLVLSLGDITEHDVHSSYSTHCTCPVQVPKLLSYVTRINFHSTGYHKTV